MCDIGALDNAKQAYEQALKYSSTDPEINLNYAIFLCNINSRTEAAKQLSEYKKKMEATSDDFKKQKNLVDEEARHVLKQLEAKLH